MWRLTRVVSTGSTNADVVTLARAGEPEGYVLVAGEQTAGRGRLGRSWSSPPDSSLAVSALLRPTDVPARRWSWLPLLVGVAAVAAVRDAAGVDAVLKWPNDVLLDGRKLAGILVERVETPTGVAAVAGLGMNVSDAPEGSASLAHTSANVEDVLAALLDHFGERYRAWQAAPGAPDLAAAYRAACETIGRDVRAELPGTEPLTGRAVAVDDDGRLVIVTSRGEVVVGAGDVVHLRTNAG
jgi:BirA family transcriptional regulator, biotin operon repressor / biotin---[acetyl-CoA-carboxylase] ligase